MGPEDSLFDGIFEGGLPSDPTSHQALLGRNSEPGPSESVPESLYLPPQMVCAPGTVKPP